MRIPNGPNGFPTVSANMLRTYGVGGFKLTEQEDSKGCPRKWKWQYGSDERPEQERSFALEYGSMIHEILYTMEEEAVGPDEALDRHFRSWMTPENYREAKNDLITYLERGASPVDRFGTVSVENHLDALLYEDEEFGPIYYQGIIDWIGVDLDDPSVLRVVDYKTNRFPPSKQQVRGDVQLKGYHWLIAQNWSMYMKGNRPRVIVHLDAIKWQDIEVAFTDGEIEEWHSWCVAVVRQILRDEEHLPVLNPGCSFCPINGDCPAFQALPETGLELLQSVPGADAADDTRLAWRDSANKVKLLLDKQVKAIDAGFIQRAEATGYLETGQYVFQRESEWEDQIDVQALHKVLGDEFYDVITVGKGRLTALTKDWPPDDLAAVRNTISRVPVGSKITKKKRS